MVYRLQRWGLGSTNRQEHHRDDEAHDHRNTHAVRNCSAFSRSGGASAKSAAIYATTADSAINAGTVGSLYATVSTNGHDDCPDHSHAGGLPLSGESGTGRTPNVVERAGVLEDYILADATMPPATRPGTPPGAVGTSGAVPSTGNMYKVENIPDERLKALVGKRVEVSGRIDPEDAGLGGASTRDRGPGPDQVNLPEFEASSIREVGGTCPAVPASRK